MWQATFFVLCALLLFSLWLCSYTAYCFKTGNFPFVWPVKLLRFFVAVFFDLFYVSALDVFLMALACNVRASCGMPSTSAFALACFQHHPTVFCLHRPFSPEQIAGPDRGKLFNYTTIQCFGFPNVLFAGISAVMCARTPPAFRFYPRARETSSSVSLPRERIT